MQRRVRTAPKYGRAFANWFERKLEEVRAAREDPKLSDSKAAELIGISHAMVSRFRAALSLPSRATTRALVIGLNAQRVGATVAEVEQLVAESDPGRAPAGGVHTSGAVRGIQNADDEARLRLAVEAGVGVALRFSRGDPTDEVLDYIRGFETAVDAAHRAKVGGRDESPAGGEPGAGAAR
jgi:transcriptional regulator with XRE-family HTH domain